MHIISINLGTPKIERYENEEVFTAGNKTPVAAARLGLTHFEGDGQADLKNHGGPDKAVCVYSFEHYPYWEEWLGGAQNHVSLQPGAFSENLTIDDLRETEVCIGDIFVAGEARLQLSQPRVPCSKLAGKRGQRNLPAAIRQNGFSGFYLRVLQPGWIRVGDAFELVTRHPAAVTVDFANAVMYKKYPDRESLQRLLAVPELAAVWRETLSQRI